MIPVLPSGCTPPGRGPSVLTLVFAFVVLPVAATAGCLLLLRYLHAS